MRAHDGVVVGIVALSLACSGLMDPLGPIGVPPIAESPAPNPLVFDQRYVYAADDAARPEWVDEGYLFHPDGTCEHQLEFVYRCTWNATVKAGIWTIDITGYTGGTDAEGQPLQTIALSPGTKLEVGSDGQSLFGKGRQPFILERL